MIKKGYKVNDLIVIGEKMETNEKGKKVWLCKCKCGNEKYILLHSLSSKRIRDCGCGSYKLNQYNNKKYGMLTVINTFRKRINGKINIMCEAICDCGNKTIVIGSEIKRKKVLSCGCVSHKKLANIVGENPFEIIKNDVENTTKSFTKNTPKNILKRLKHIYFFMKERCYNINHISYHNYGGRGITICDEWLNDFNNFYEWSLKNGYIVGLSIDRIDNNKNYNPDNCRWVKKEKQSSNRRNCIKYNVNGELLSIAEIAKKCNIKYGTFLTRLKSGLTLEQAMTYKKNYKKEMIK